MRAILVDDELSNLENLRALLSKHCPHIKVISASVNIDDAFKQINLHQPDLLFLDIQMGKNTGFDLLSRLTEKLLK